MMKKHSLKIQALKRSRFVVLFLLSALNSLAFASIDVYEFEDESKREEFVALTKELRCPKCQNQDIADSNAPIAADMRKEVHRLLEEGHDRESIVNHMIERFGDFVTYKPKVSVETLMLWYGPWIFVLIGLLIIGSKIRFNKSAGQKKNREQGSGDETTDNASTHIQSDDHQTAFSDEVKNLLAKYDDTEHKS
jgi:cytochrome c-type biogenesis protein CcmH